MMAGYNPYMYGMAGRNGYRARTRDYMPGWKYDSSLRKCVIYLDIVENWY